MKIFIDLLKFSAVTYILFYLPGHCIFTKIFKKNDSGALEKNVISLCIGLLLIPQVYYYLQNEKVCLVYLASLGVFSVFYLFYIVIKNWPHYKMEKHAFSAYFNINSMIMASMIILIIVITLFVLGRSGVAYKDGLRFYQANAFDSVADMAMVSELSKAPIHQSPFYAGIPFKGFHTGSFYWRALMQKITRIHPIDLFFRYCPLFLFPLILLTVFVSVNKVFKSSAIAALAVFLIFFMSDLSWVFPVLDRIFISKDIKTVNLLGNFIGDFLLNPPVAHGVLIFFTGCYFLQKLFSRGTFFRKWIHIIFIGFIFGSLFEYKAYMGVIALAAIFLTAFKEYVFDRKNEMAWLFLCVFLFGLISFYRLSNSSSADLFGFKFGYFPLTILQEMGWVDSIKKVSVFIILFSFLIYLLGALGIKIVGFFNIYKDAIKWRTISPVRLFLLSALALSFIFTHSLILKSDFAIGTYDFFSIFILIIAVFAAQFIMSFMQDKNKVFKRAFVFIIAMLGIGSTLFSLLAFFPQYAKYKVVSPEFAEAAEYIRINSSRDSVIMHKKNDEPLPWVYPDGHSEINLHEKGRDSFVSALTQRRSFFECSWHMDACRISNEAYARRKDTDLFFDTNDANLAKALLDKHKINYVWLEKNQTLNFQKNNILKETFSNEGIKIYKKI